MLTKSECHWFGMLSTSCNIVVICSSFTLYLDDIRCSYLNKTIKHVNEVIRREATLQSQLEANQPIARDSGSTLGCQGTSVYSSLANDCCQSSTENASVLYL